MKNHKLDSVIDVCGGIIGVLLEFVWGGFISAVGLGIVYLILFGLSYAGIASTVTATMWVVCCWGGAIFFGLGFLVNFVMGGTSFVSMPVLWLGMTLVPCMLLAPQLQLVLV